MVFKYTQGNSTSYIHLTLFQNPWLQICLTLTCSHLSLRNLFLFFENFVKVSFDHAHPVPNIFQIHSTSFTLNLTLYFCFFQISVVYKECCSDTLGCLVNNVIKLEEVTPLKKTWSSHQLSIAKSSLSKCWHFYPSLVYTVVFCFVLFSLEFLLVYCILLYLLWINLCKCPTLSGKLSFLIVAYRLCFSLSF